MSTFLLTWNPTKFKWETYDDDQITAELGFETIIDWSCGTRKNMPIGSRIFMMRLGYRQPIHGIFASGYSVSSPEADEHWYAYAKSPTSHYIDVKLDVMLNPEVHSLLEPEEKVRKDFNWRPQVSGIRIPDDIAQLLENAWHTHLHTIAFQPIDVPETLPSVEQTPIYIEGRKSRVTVNRYERDPRARKECIKHHGAFCHVCGFDFKDVYGDLGLGFIHVHHREPLAAQNGHYMVDPIKDLIPVCPNCHAMLHRETPPLTIEYLKQNITRQRS